MTVFFSSAQKLFFIHFFFELRKKEPSESNKTPINFSLYSDGRLLCSPHKNVEENLTKDSPLKRVT
jgi:hypothetical protein